jgi:hypothetical protein
LGDLGVDGIITLKLVLNKYTVTIKGKSVPLQAWSGPEGSKGFQEVKFPRFHNNGTGWW